MAVTSVPIFASYEHGRKARYKQVYCFRELEREFHVLTHTS